MKPVGVEITTAKRYRPPDKVFFISKIGKGKIMKDSQKPHNKGGRKHYPQCYILFSIITHMIFSVILRTHVYKKCPRHKKRDAVNSLNIPYSRKPPQL